MTTPDSPLARAAAAYRATIPPGLDRYEFPLHALDRVGVPVYYAAAFTPDDVALTGVGYGPDDLAARTSALGEMAETYGTFASFRALPRRGGSYNDLRRDGVLALDPLECRLPVGTSYTADRPLQWVEATRWPDGARRWVPLEFAASNVGDTGPGDWLFTPITNGMGAGDTLERAIAHGLLELVQRDGNSLSYRALDQGVAIDLDAVDDPVVQDLRARFDAAGIDVLPKLASTAFGIANVYVVGGERDPRQAPHPVMLTACGEAAHPDRARALRKALLEFCSSRARKRFAHDRWDVVAPLLPDGYRARLERNPPGWDEEGRALHAMRDLMAQGPEAVVDLIRDTVLSVRQRVPYTALPTVTPGALDDPAALLADVAGRLGAEGLEVWYVDVTPPGAPARAVKVLVPELEVEGMSYHRVGARGVRLLAERGDGLAGVNAHGGADLPAGLARVPLTAEAEAELGGHAWFDVAEAERRLGRLYALYREPGEHVLAFAARAEGAAAS
ncbi:methanogenesis marker 1 protein [Gemmatimonadetes bacterium T265]|nr:methanogenesis marker 1 protein [Gemmatimonadetes bacterium T265]